MPTLTLQAEISRQRAQLRKAFMDGLYDAGTALADGGSGYAMEPNNKYALAYNNGMAYALQVYKLLQLISSTESTNPHSTT